MDVVSCIEADVQFSWSGVVLGVWITVLWSIIWEFQPGRQLISYRNWCACVNKMGWTFLSLPTCIYKEIAPRSIDFSYEPIVHQRIVSWRRTRQTAARSRIADVCLEPTFWRYHTSCIQRWSHCCCCGIHSALARVQKKKRKNLRQMDSPLNSHQDDLRLSFLSCFPGVEYAEPEPCRLTTDKQDGPLGETLARTRAHARA